MMKDRQTEIEVLKREYVYFAVTQGSDLERLTSDWHQDRLDAFERQTAFKNKIGAIGTWGYTGRPIGYTWGDGVKPPKGWRHYARLPKGTYGPDKTPIGRQYAVDMANMHAPDAHDLTSMLEYEGAYGRADGRGGFSIKFITAVNVGADHLSWVLIVPYDVQGKHWNPDDKFKGQSQWIRDSVFWHKIEDREDLLWSLYNEKKP